MKNYKVIATLFVFGALITPGLTLANSAYYSEGGFYEEPPVQSTGTIINTNSNTQSVINPADSLPTGNLLGIKFKTKAERDAQKAQEEANKSRALEDARVARNADGSLAYGYTNANGAQYTNGVKYVDARNVKNGKSSGNNNLAAAGSLFGQDFLPDTVGGWILALILLAILFSIIRAFTQKMNQNRVNAHAHMAH